MHLPFAFCRPQVISLATSRFLSSARSLSQPIHVLPTSKASIRCSHSHPSTAKRKRVGVVIVGNEILNGKTLDKNLSTLAKHVESNGATLYKAVTIRDDIQIIAQHVRDMSMEHDLIFTSGGIGPTLDDVTYAGVAEAFSLPLVRHQQTVDRMKQADMELNPARLRMAELPRDCEVLWTEDLWVPLAVVNNVYILPGIPSLFQKMLGSVPIERFGEASQRAKKVVLCDMAEGDLAQLLENVSIKYEGVDFGSYPATTVEARNRYRSMITLEGDHGEEVSTAAEIVRVGVNGRYEQEVP